MYHKSFGQWVKRLSRLITIVGILILLLFNKCLVPAVHATAMAITVDTQIDSNDPAYQACTEAPDDCSLRGAISKANADSGTVYTIELPAGTYTLTSAGDDDDNAVGDLDIKSSLTLVGSGEESTIIDGNHLDRVLQIQAGATVEISHVKITGGKAPAGCYGMGGQGSDGGGIYNAGSLTLVNSAIMANAAGEGGYGGGSRIIAGNGGNGGGGGGIYNAGTLTITNCTITANSGGKGGYGGDGFWGGVAGNGGNGGNGGGIYNSGIMMIAKSMIEENSSGSGGPGGSGEGDFGPEDGTPGTNGTGGGISTVGTSTLLQSIIENNSTNGSTGYRGGNGGGIYAAGKAVVTDSKIDTNTTFSNDLGGGGIFIGPSVDMTLTNTTILANTTGEDECGSGIYMSSAGSVKLVNDIVAGNLTGPYGYAAIEVKDSSPQFLHTTIAQNTGGDGSGIYAAGSTLSLINTILVDQIVGVVVDKDSTATLEATLWANQNDWGGAGVVNAGSHNYWGDPAFVNPAALDYHLLAASAAIDKGVATDSNYDIDNQPRPNPNTGVPDLGADEYYPSPVYLPLIPSPCIILRPQPSRDSVIPPEICVTSSLPAAP